MAYTLNTDSVISTLKKLSGGAIPTGGFFGDWVDTQLVLHANELEHKIEQAAAAQVTARSGKYYKAITVGKPYTLKGIRTIRVYAERPAYHANLIEYGFMHAGKAGRMIGGKYVYTKAGQDYEATLANNIETAFAREVEELIT